MIKSIISCAILCTTTTISYSQNIQKKDVDTSVFGKWNYVSEPTITDDGNYAGYVTQYYRFGNPKTLTIKSTSGIWHKDYGPGIVRFSFLSDNKRLLLLSRDNILTVSELGSGKVTKTYSASSYQLFKYKGKEWLLIDGTGKDLILINCENNRELILSDVDGHYETKDLDKIFLIKNTDTLSFIDLNDLIERVVGKFPEVHDLVWDENGNAIAFMMDKAVWCYRLFDKKPQLLIRTDAPLSDSSFFISGINKFSQDNKRLFITLTSKPHQDILTDHVKMKIWNSESSKFSPVNNTGATTSSFLSFISLKDNKVTQIQKIDEEAGFVNDLHDNLIVVKYQKGSELEKHWNPLGLPRYYIYNCLTMDRTEVDIERKSISPDGQYIIGRDLAYVQKYNIFGEYKALQISSNKSYSMTAGLNRFVNQRLIPSEDQKVWSHVGWINDHTALMYDEYDIWKIDVSKTGHAENLTQNAGKENQIKFYFAIKPVNKIFEKKDLSLLFAFDEKTKQNGFYRLDPSRKKPLQKLYMGDCIVGGPEEYPIPFYEPLKARNANRWLVMKEHSDSSANIYLTEDFKTFKPISDNYPEREFNWITTELINYITLDGKPSQAVLYKPSNFDPTKKYPIIFNYYQKLSYMLNRYLVPDAVHDNLNIPWFVSRGYLVCTPDIIYTKMRPGESAVNSVEGIARYLAKRDYVDSTRMGIDGHSWGGFETNYIITHSNYFKAAVSASAISDLISAATTLTLGGINFKDFSTFYRYERFGVSLWDRPDLYISHSPIMDAAKVKSPILLMSNEKDGIINVQQGIQFFYSLRRLGKPAWLVQYDEEGHSLLNRENSKHFGLKMLDFFDYYLKGKSKPEWMKQTN